MKKGKIESVFILDRSGSMGSVWNDAKNSFGSFLKEQKESGNDVNITFVTFNSKPRTEIDNVHVSDVNESVMNGINPNGFTALYDAIGKTFDSIGERLSKTPEEEKPEKVIVGIMTDGFENASKDYNASRIKEMIKHQEEVYNWDVIFFGANQDSFLTAGNIGIRTSNVANYVNGKDGLNTSYSLYSARVSAGASDVSLHDIARKRSREEMKGVDIGGK